MSNIPKCITQQLFENALRKYLKNEKLKILNFTSSSAAASSESYNSSLIRSRITYSTGHNGDKNTITVMVKCCPEIDGQPFEVTNDMRFFDKEIQMYTTMLPHIYRVLGGMHTMSAKYIYVEQSPVRIIVMEDLSEKGFKMADRRKGLDLEHCKLTVKKLAQLHAASLLVYKKEPKDFDIFYQALIPGNSTISYWLNIALEEIIKAGAKRPNLAKCIQKLKKVQHILIEKCEEAAKPSSRFNILNHGDCWTNNIMFKYDDNGKLEDLRLVDYQIGVFSSPAIDLHYFWTTSPSIAVRRQHLPTILDYYYEQLVCNANELQGHCDNIPSKEDFLEDWSSRSYYGFGSAVTVLSLTKASNRDDASVLTLLDPNKDGEGSFRHELYNNPLYWEHLEYIITYFDSLGIFDC